jgi:hypothetical protein
MAKSTQDDPQKAEIIEFLRERVFDPILSSPKASERLKRGVRVTVSRMERLDADGVHRYYWSAIAGTPNAIEFAEDMKKEGFGRFEEVLEEFRKRFPMKRRGSKV